MKDMNKSDRLPYVSPTTDVCIVVANGFLCSSNIGKQKVELDSNLKVNDLIKGEEITFDI